MKSKQVITMGFNREVTITGKNLKYVDIHTVPDNAERGKKERRKKEKKTTKKQMAANRKRARRKFIALVNNNFGKNDYHVVLTYSDKYLPKSDEEADRNIRNFKRRVKYKFKKAGKEPPKIIDIPEYKKLQSGEMRYHHHVLIQGGLSRDEIEECWQAPKEKGKPREAYGYANCYRLQPDELGLENLARYLFKFDIDGKHWRGTKNLEKPVERKNDYKYSHKKVREMVENLDDHNMWRKLYPGYYCVKVEKKFNDELGWSIYATLRREVAK